jgi:hypothetical protein
MGVVLGRGGGTRYRGGLGFSPLDVPCARPKLTREVVGEGIPCVF